MQVNLKNLIAVVTGGSSGIGLEVARILLQCGASVAICGRDESRLVSAEQSLGSKRVYAHVCNVLDEYQVSEFARSVGEQLGKIDMLICNAGQGRVSTFSNTTDADWSDELNLKMFSVIYPVRAFRADLEHSSQGAIVCVNSLLARQPEPHMVATASARAAQMSMVKSMATEFAPVGIRVNSILLGLVHSGQWRRRFDHREDKTQNYDSWSAELARNKQIPLGRLGDPEEAATAVVFLASPASSYITGTALEVSGGLSRYV